MTITESKVMTATEVIQRRNEFIREIVAEVDREDSSPLKTLSNQQGKKRLDE